MRHILKILKSVDHQVVRFFKCSVYLDELVEQELLLSVERLQSTLLRLDEDVKGVKQGLHV